MTVEQYGDFEMRFEWKITEYGNSGVIYRIATTEPYPWHTGPEYQVLDNARHPDGKNPITSSGSNYAVERAGEGRDQAGRPMERRPHHRRRAITSSTG